MKWPFFAAATFLTIIFLSIIAFENINSMLMHWSFFFSTVDNPFLMVVFLAFMGFMIGFFLIIFIMLTLSPNDDEESGSEMLS